VSVLDGHKHPPGTRALLKREHPGIQNSWKILQPGHHLNTARDRSYPLPPARCVYPDFTVVCWQSNDLKFGHVQKTPASRQCVQDPEQSVVRGGVGNRPAVDQTAPEERFDCVARYELLVRGNYNAISARHDLTFRLSYKFPCLIVSTQGYLRVSSG